MKLKELLRNIIDTDFDAEIEGVTCSPRRILKENYLFVSVSEVDKNYLSKLEELSVIIILGEGKNIPVKRPVIFHPDPQKIYAEIVSRFYRFRHPKYVAAVTGTSGKTSVSGFCYQIWQNAGYSSACIGTLGTCLNNDVRSNRNRLTTPDAYDLYSVFCEMNNKNIEHLVIEAATQGIDQYRLHGLKLSAAAFTNFSHEHLDYHGSMDRYLETKKRLFSEVLPEGKTVVLNGDIDEYNILFNIAKKRNNRIIRYGKKQGSTIRLLKQTPTVDGQCLTIKINDKSYSTYFPILGKFQAYNLLCAIGISGLDYSEVCIEKLCTIKGRLEKINSFAFVDYAHTAYALKQALLSLKWHFRKKIVLVFGCGGNRDQMKRLSMGEVALKYADKIIVTDDNPRNEDPAKIRNDILLGCPDALEIGDREKAIENGIETAYNEGMILLVAGKGHEETQIIGDQAFEFSDASTIRLKSSHFL